MVHLAESLEELRLCYNHFLTKTPKEIFAQLGIEDESLTTWDSLNEFGADSSWHNVVKKGNPIFPRLDMEEEVSIY